MNEKKYPIHILCRFQYMVMCVVFHFGFGSLSLSFVLPHAYDVVVIIDRIVAHRFGLCVCLCVCMR